MKPRISTIETISAFDWLNSKAPEALLRQHQIDSLTERVEATLSQLAARPARRLKSLLVLMSALRVFWKLDARGGRNQSRSRDVLSTVILEGIVALKARDLKDEDRTQLRRSIMQLAVRIPYWAHFDREQYYEAEVSMILRQASRM